MKRAQSFSSRWWIGSVELKGLEEAVSLNVCQLQEGILLKTTKDKANIFEPLTVEEGQTS
jgi:hypothetical protein